MTDEERSDEERGSEPLLEPWGEHPTERVLEKGRAAGVEITWKIDEHSAREPKTRARIERARSRGYKVEIHPGPPQHTIFFGPPPVAQMPKETEGEDETR